MTPHDPDLLQPLIDALPVGVIMIDRDNCVRAWNSLAEEFIEAAKRPTLVDGLTLEATHPGAYGAGMAAVLERLRAGETVPPKIVERDGRSFRVHYRAMASEAEGYLGVVQVIESLEEGAS